MVGSAVVRELAALGTDPLVAERGELDLTNQADVRRFMQDARPDAVILAAAKVGGIQANNEFPASFIHENLAIQCNIIHEAYCAGVRRLLFLGSSCIYPRNAPQPMSEDALLTGLLEPTNEPYAIAKIAGIKMCESYNRQYGTDYRSIMPTNLYGQCDNFDTESSHVLPALMRRFHEATQTGRDEVVIWGTGKPKREFLHVDDMARASLFVLGVEANIIQAHTRSMLSHINVGCGSDVSIAELATLIARITGFTGEISFDTSRPDGTPRKLLDVSKLSAMGWHPQTTLEEGVRQTYEWYCANQHDLRGA
jgi:GDP-L-fucose synthase